MITVTWGTGWQTASNGLTQLLRPNMAKNFAFLRRDDNNVPIMTGTHIQCFDATAGTPQESPLSVTNLSVTTLAIPENAAEIVFTPSGAMRVSEAATMATGYFVQAASVTQAWGVAGMDNIYIQGDAGVITLQFYFVLVKE